MITALGLGLYRGSCTIGSWVSHSGRVENKAAGINHTEETIMSSTALRMFVAMALFAGGVDNALAQRVIARQQCQTVYQGQLVQGILQIEQWTYHDTHRIYGQFRTASGDLVELEVFTNQPGGVGGMWFNNARHREIHVRVQLLNNGFTVLDESGNFAQYACQ
jgi:hypothetical protein